MDSALYTILKTSSNFCVKIPALKLKQKTENLKRKRKHNRSVCPGVKKQLLQERNGSIGFNGVELQPIFYYLWASIL